MPAAYFALPVEPPVFVGWIALGLAWAAATLAMFGRARWRFAFIWALLAALLLGFGLAKLREVTSGDAGAGAGPWWRI